MPWGQSPAPALALPPGKGIGVFGANLPAASSPLCKIWEAFLTGGGCCSSMGPQAGFWWVSAPPNPRPHCLSCIRLFLQLESNPTKTKQPRPCWLQQQKHPAPSCLLYRWALGLSFPFLFSFAALEKLPASSQTCCKADLHPDLGK